MKYEIPAMLKNGSGAIVNMSSANGLVGLAGMAAYTTAKHGIIRLTRSAALELAESNIRVCAIAPGYVATPRILDSGKEALDYMAAAHPMKRLATREELADLVAYLLSERASNVYHGQCSLHRWRIYSSIIGLEVSVKAKEGMEVQALSNLRHI